MLPFHSTLEDFFRRNFHEEIARLGLDASPSSIARRSVRSASAGEIPTSPHSTSTSSIGEKHLSRAMTLGRGGPSLYANPHVSQLYAATPGSPHALQFDVNGAIIPSSMNGAMRRDQDTQTPLQRNLAHLARNGIPGMSHALLSGSVTASPGSIVNGSGYHVDTPETGHRPSRIGQEPTRLVGQPSTASFSTLLSPRRTYQHSTISRNPSIANTISGRISRFGSLLRRGDR